MKQRGAPYAIASAVLLGIAPIFGKQGIRAGLDPLTLVAGRTAGAALLLLIAVGIFSRRHLAIYPVGLAGCLIAGILNGTGSLFYYAALARIDAGLGQLLFTIYPVLVAVLLYLDGRQPSTLTVVRLLLSLPGIYLLTQADRTNVDLLGMGFMLIAALLYALHIPINQRVLFEAPAPTVTLYTLLAMTAIVVPASLVLTRHPFSVPHASVNALLGLTVVTFLSRLTLFAGVKLIGGVQTSLFGLAELLVTIILARLILGEDLSLQQWVGAGILVGTLALAAFDRTPQTAYRFRGWLYWLRSPLTKSVNPQTEREGSEDVMN
ncbi:MAG: DMT family transporter [Anaerolineales bacterium]|jgi:drug/metabolite transporter (DMT)-like permease